MTKTSAVGRKLVLESQKKPPKNQPKATKKKSSGKRIFIVTQEHRWKTTVSAHALSWLFQYYNGKHLQKTGHSQRRVAYVRVQMEGCKPSCKHKTCQAGTAWGMPAGWVSRCNKGDGLLEARTDYDRYSTADVPVYW